MTEFLKANNIKNIKLPVSAFHCKLMKKATTIMKNRKNRLSNK